MLFLMFFVNTVYTVDTDLLILCLDPALGPNKLLERLMIERENLT